uniref:DUF6590 domain-containing protein n=1 Tax=Colletotrichum fructicola (strain Nara gc5) TaxID=1213859 RepID=L2FTU3_COLFN
MVIGNREFTTFRSKSTKSTKSDSGKDSGNGDDASVGTHESSYEHPLARKGYDIGPASRLEIGDVFEFLWADSHEFEWEWKCLGYTRFIVLRHSDTFPHYVICVPISTPTKNDFQKPGIDSSQQGYVFEENDRTPPFDKLPFSPVMGVGDVTRYFDRVRRNVNKAVMRNVLKRALEQYRQGKLVSKKGAKLEASVINGGPDDDDDEPDYDLEGESERERTSPVPEMTYHVNESFVGSRRSLVEPQPRRDSYADAARRESYHQAQSQPRHVPNAEPAPPPPAPPMPPPAPPMPSHLNNMPPPAPAMPPHLNGASPAQYNSMPPSQAPSIRNLDRDDAASIRSFASDASRQRRHSRREERERERERNPPPPRPEALERRMSNHIDGASRPYRQRLELPRSRSQRQEGSVYDVATARAD